MSYHDIITPAGHVGETPAIRTITPADLREVLANGLDDFRAMPTHAVFLCIIYPVVGLLLARATFGLDIIPLLYPIASGFALVGPFAAIGLYELSRRRALGLDTSWRHAFDIVHSPSFRSIAALGLLLLLIFGIWIATAHAIYVASFGYREPVSLLAFAGQVLTTPAGHNLIIVGNAVGLVFAAVAFVLSAVSFPLLLDRNVGVAAAILTSARAVLRNPLTMALWALIVAGGLVLGSLPFFIGLAVIVPVLGHATWHLYQRLVEPDHGAQFPASLFTTYRDKEDRPE